MNTLHAHTERYHKDLHSFVKDIQVGQVSLDWTQHALVKTWERGISPLCLVTIPKGCVFEVELSRQSVVKMGVRLSYDASFDLCLIIAPNVNSVGKFTVITAWLNRKGDVHVSLDKSKYAKVA